MLDRTQIDPQIVLHPRHGVLNPIDPGHDLLPGLKKSLTEALLPLLEALLALDEVLLALLEPQGPRAPGRDCRSASASFAVRHRQTWVGGTRIFYHHFANKT